MSIKIPLTGIVRAMQTNALKRVSSFAPPGRYGFYVAKLVAAVEQEYRDYTRQQDALIRLHGVPQHDAEGKPTGAIGLQGATPAQQEAFQKAVADLLATEVTLPYDPIVFARLGERAEAELTIGDILALGPLLLEDEEAPPLKTVP